MNLLSTTDQLLEDLRPLRFSEPVDYVYNPLDYAREPYHNYLESCVTDGCEAVFVGMNPGPWGMAQTGVPFGEVRMVTDWLGIHGRVDTPQPEHPKKRIEGFNCRRSEVSGRRLWGLFQELCGAREAFFKRFLVINYCPLLFLDSNGRNITPDKLKSSERKPLQEACDKALLRYIEYLQPGMVIGIGNFAQDRAAAVLKHSTIPVGKILHPSPASPAANRDWKQTVIGQLRDYGLIS